MNSIEDSKSYPIGSPQAVVYTDAEIIGNHPRVDFKSTSISSLTVKVNREYCIYNNKEEKYRSQLCYNSSPFAAKTVSAKGHTPRSIEKSLTTDILSKNELNTRYVLLELLTFQNEFTATAKESCKVQPSPASIAKTMRFFIVEQIIISYFHFSNNPIVLPLIYKLIYDWDKEGDLNKNYPRILQLAYLLTCIEYSTVLLNASAYYDSRKTNVNKCENAELKPRLEPLVISKKRHITINEIKTIPQPIIDKYRNCVPYDIFTTFNRLIVYIQKQDLDALQPLDELICENLISPNKYLKDKNFKIALNLELRKLLTSSNYSRAPFPLEKNRYKYSTEEEKIRADLRLNPNCSITIKHGKWYKDETGPQHCVYDRNSRKIQNIDVFWYSKIMEKALHQISTHLTPHEQHKNRNHNETFYEELRNIFPLQFSTSVLNPTLRQIYEEKPCNVNFSLSFMFTNIGLFLWSILFDLFDHFCQSLNIKQDETTILSNYIKGLKNTLITYYKLYRDQEHRKQNKNRIRHDGTAKLQCSDHFDFQRQCLMQATIILCRFHILTNRNDLIENYSLQDKQIQYHLAKYSDVTHESKEIIAKELKEHHYRPKMLDSDANNARFCMRNVAGFETFFTVNIPESIKWIEVRRLLLKYYPKRKTPQIYKPKCNICGIINKPLFAFLNSYSFICHNCYEYEITQPRNCSADSNSDVTQVLRICSCNPAKKTQENLFQIKCTLCNQLNPNYMGPVTMNTYENYNAMPATILNTNSNLSDMVCENAMNRLTEPIFDIIEITASDNDDTDETESKMDETHDNILSELCELPEQTEQFICSQPSTDQPQQHEQQYTNFRFDDEVIHHDDILITEQDRERMEKRRKLWLGYTT